MQQVSLRLKPLGRAAALAVSLALMARPCGAQEAPTSPDRPWSIVTDSRFESAIPGPRKPEEAVNPGKVYTLAELVDLAERRNPETRLAWEQAKQRAAALGIAKAALFPTLGAIASASVNKYSLFFDRFYREDTGVFPVAVNVSYTLLDFGARTSRIDLARANLLASDFAFNDTHRRLVFQVTEAYYGLLDAVAQQDAARATLTDALAIQESLEGQLASGLATLPDVLEARAAAAHARYELASVQGLEATARGALATTLSMRPGVSFRLEDLSRIPLPAFLDEPFETMIDRALGQRPDLLAQVARLRAAEAQTDAARSSFAPTITVSGDWGHSNSYGQQNLGPIFHSSMYPYQAQVRLNWTLFDGGARRQLMARSEAERGEAEAQLTSLRDRIENELWVAYANLKTARQREEAADALLEAATQTFAAMQQAFESGVRTFIDVTSAQRDLARARAAQVSARTQLLTSVADLAFRAGELVRAPAPGTTP